VSRVSLAYEIVPETPVQFLKGVGEARAALLAEQGIRTARDLLFWFPHRWEDRRHPTRIRDIRRSGEPVVLRGTVRATATKITPRKRMAIFEAVLDDGTGSLPMVFFNQGYLAERILKDDLLSVYGIPRVSAWGGRLELDNPEWEKIDPARPDDEEGEIVPIYGSLPGIPDRVVRALIRRALDVVPAIEEALPPALAERLGVISRKQALLAIHAPADLTPELVDGSSAAHRRLILEEFFSFQLALRLRRAAEETKAKTRRIEITDAIRQHVREILPFRLTRAQKRVLKEITADLRSERPMYRLLQGDVGSGKTIVALIAALVAIENGHQAALLAPTEILAEQHFQKIAQMVGANVRVAKLAGSTKAAQRRPLLAALQAGEVDLLIGTHALLEHPVTFRSLGLAIVDEQHRFGVAQRQKLFEKGDLPDILVMTATPIPRSLAIALYGDLELSVIDELPPGRQPVRTVVRGSNQMPKVWSFVEQELAAGSQAYVVFPIIDESETLDVKALTAGVGAIRKSFPGRRVGILHGRMAADEKERTMAAFKGGDLDLLVSTTVIEVGIDVPNASVMVILDADRFGLSQLHQLRGRVGRGTRKSWCVLIRDETSAEEAKQRLRLFEQTRDGFEVAEKDLALRGPGDFFGTRQSGAPRFRFGHILRDWQLMELAREAAIEAVEQSAFGDPLELARGITGTATLVERD
jgi:ATP-dependent DNA helicase RecG